MNVYLFYDAFINSVTIVKSLFCLSIEKNFTFVTHRGIKRIIEQYGGAPGQIVNSLQKNLGYGYLHYSLIRVTRPKHVLCIGSRYGYIPALCALACKENSYGKVDFVDAGYDRSHPKAWGGEGFWKQIDPEKHFALIGLSEWITTFVMTSQKYNKRFAKKTYDYVYIDGDHSYEGVFSDYLMFWPRLRKGGFMLFHDISQGANDKQSPFGAWKVWQKILKMHQYGITFPNQRSGLGVLQKS